MQSNTAITITINNLLLTS